MGSGEGGQRERGRGRLGDTNRKQKREDTFVSPLIKWLMFSFNMFFWVSDQSNHNELIEVTQTAVISYYWQYNIIGMSTTLLIPFN